MHTRTHTPFTGFWILPRLSAYACKNCQSHTTCVQKNVGDCVSRLAFTRFVGQLPWHLPCKITPEQRPALCQNASSPGKKSREVVGAVQYCQHYGNVDLRENTWAVKGVEAEMFDGVRVPWRDLATWRYETGANTMIYRKEREREPCQ